MGITLRRVTAYNVYKFSVPEKGVVSIKLESENEDFFDQGHSDRVIYSIYKSSNIDKPTDSFDITGDYLKSRGVYTGQRSSSLHKGEYYLVIEADVWNNEPLGEYSSKKYSFQINYSPSISQPILNKITATKKSAKIRWTRIDMADSYEIQLSKSKKFPKSQTKVFFTTNGTTINKKLSGLKRKTTYYLRIRTIKSIEVDGKNNKYKSKWSAYHIKTK